MAATRYIAFDAASSTGWAFRAAKGVHEGRWETGILEPRDWKAVDAVLRHAKMCGITNVAIEDCYLGVNPQTHKVLAICQGLLLSACDRAGLEVDVIFAQSWQSDLKLTGKRAERKRGAKWVAVKVLGVDEGQPQDVYDAACLCDFANRVHEREVE